MPELPQVETVRRFLQSVLIQSKVKKIKNINIYYPSIIKEIQPFDFMKILKGQTFTSIDRYGKYLIIELNTHSIISHLRMEGKYFYHDKKVELTKHDHVEFKMTDGSTLIYSDVRKFGTMQLVKKGTQMMTKSLSKLGPQVNGQHFTADYLQEALSTKQKSIKQTLLDQQIVCGIGNIYADEILYAAGIDPTTIANKVKKDNLQSIVKQGRKIINRAIINKGTTFRSFSTNNEEGEFQNCLKVYGRSGQQCEQCGHTILKIKLAQRGTHYCPQCQKK